MRFNNIEASRLLAGDHPSTSRAAAWVREHFLVPDDETVVEMFEQVFHCQLVIGDRRDPWMQPDHILFDTEQDLTMFLLRWS